VVGQVGQGMSFVITHKGEVLGFLVRDLPEPLLELGNNAPAHPFQQAQISYKTVKQWSAKGIIRLTRHNRHRLWFVASTYQNVLTES
jgi:hypothetical protein